MTPAAEDRSPIGDAFDAMPEQQTPEEAELERKVDTEGLRKALADEVEYRVRTAVALAMNAHEYEHHVVQGRDAVGAILSDYDVKDLDDERTEYALEVGHEEDTDGVIFSISDDAATPEELQQWLPEARLVTRTVGFTPWRPIPTEDVA